MDHIWPLIRLRWGILDAWLRRLVERRLGRLIRVVLFVAVARLKPFHANLLIKPYATDVFRALT
jgi:hypothetical protein